MAKIIENNTLQGLINYLSKRPWEEVDLVMPTLLNLPDVPIVEQPSATEVGES